MEALRLLIRLFSTNPPPPWVPRAKWPAVDRILVGAQSIVIIDNSTNALLLLLARLKAAKHVARRTTSWS